MTEQVCCTLCGAAGHRAAQCNWNAPGALESIRLPAHGTTIALDEVLAGYLPDDREDVREVIEAYADIQARKAVMLFSGAGLAGRQSDACDWLENLEGDAWADACEEIAGAVKRQAEGAQREREAAIAKFSETCPMTAESATGGKSYDIELRRYYLLGWDDRAVLAQPSPVPELDLPERGTQHRFSTTEQTCRHDFAGVWWSDNGVVKTGCECRHCGFFVADITEAAELDVQPYRHHAEKIRRLADQAATEYEAGRSALGYMEDIAESALALSSGLDRMSAQHDRIVGALRAQLAEVQETLNCANQHRTEWQNIALQAEQQRDAAQTRMAELEKQEPIQLQHMAVAEDGELRWMTGRKIDNCELYAMPDFGRAPKLYAAPIAQADQLHALDKQCRDDVARALGLTPQGDGYAWSALLADIKTAAKVAQAGQVPEGYMLITQDQVERHATTVWECPPQSRVVLVSTLKRLHEKNSAVPQPAGGADHE